jgi:fermentation-respiration switch protein FrsA (DUF1100 family)
MTVVFLLAGAYLFVCLLVYIFQSRLIHFPDHKLVTNPGTIGLEHQDAFFETDDGLRLHGWFVPSPGSQMTVLFCHGNAGNISHRLDSIRIFYDMGLSVFIFDYRGYGRSEGKISESGLYSDASAARKYLIEELGASPLSIIYFGRSLGSAAAIELATRHQPPALIAESSFPSVCELGAKFYPWLPARWLCRIRYDSRARVAALQCPKLFIHSRDDDIVPISLGRRLHDLAAGPKTFLEISGSHNDGFLTSGVSYSEGVEKFILLLRNFPRAGDPLSSD